MPEAGRPALKAFASSLFEPASLKEESRPRGGTPPAPRSPGARIRRRLLGIPHDETLVSRRGFEVESLRVRERLETIGRAFVDGYHAALESDGEPALVAGLARVESETRGFAYEGAAMALVLLDALIPGRGGRWLRFAHGAGDRHLYMVHVGAGWALARIPFGPAVVRPPFDPLLRWLAYDGYGFHEGYFHRERSVRRGAVPGVLKGYARRAFDQGLGRSLWFGEGADPARIAGAIDRFEPGRRPDLWSGVGLAAAYAGGVERAALESLRALAGTHTARLAQGAAFGAKARERAGNPAPHTALACGTLCGMDAARAAAITDEALEPPPADGAEPAYEVWRSRVRARFAGDGA